LTIVNRIYIFMPNHPPVGVYIMSDISSRCYPLILCLSYLCGHGRKSYAYPTQQSICDLLSRYYGVVISRRTLCRWLASLESAGYIRRIRRIRRGLGGSPEFTSTLYILQAKARRLIRRLARSTAALWQWAKESWQITRTIIYHGINGSLESVKVALTPAEVRATQQAIEAEAHAAALASERLKGLDLSDPIKAMMQILDR